MLDKIGTVFGTALESSGVHLDAVTNTATRRKIALDVLRKAPLLWIWDNVETVTGFPTGTKSDWSVEEQQELRNFLTAARDTQAKFLLTSRRDEEAWLRDLPRRVRVPPMPMQERLQLAGAIAGHRGKRLADLPDLSPLLRFTQGNPMTILVAIRSALRAGIDTKEQLDAFISALRNGEAEFEDAESEGRSKSLGASLSYGFGHAFGEDERKILALLHLFQGFVEVAALRAMDRPAAKWRLDTLRGLTLERGISLLDGAAELGLLNAHGGGLYGIHPALPWYFRDLFARTYPAETADRARRAFVEAMGILGNYYFDQYLTENRQVIPVLMAEEDNFLAAWRLARKHGWWHGVVFTMQGLRRLYEETGRHAAWRRLVETVVPDLIDPATDGPIPGREEEWSLVTEYRVRIAESERDWPKAERLQRLRVDWDQEYARPTLETAAETWTNTQRHAIRKVTIEGLGNIQREIGEPACVSAYREAFNLASAIGDATQQHFCAFNLGNAYKNIADLRDLAEAERWFRKALDLAPPGDALGRSRCLGQLGTTFYERLTEAVEAKRPAEELEGLFAQAVKLQEQALETVPDTAITHRAASHNALGALYAGVGNLDSGLHHYRQAIRYNVEAGELFNAGAARFNVAVTLAINVIGRLEDARTYAEAALANFQPFGERAAANIQETERLIADIDKALAEKRGNI